METSAAYNNLLKQISCYLSNTNLWLELFFYEIEVSLLKMFKVFENFFSISFVSVSFVFADFNDNTILLVYFIRNITLKIYKIF